MSDNEDDHTVPLQDLRPFYRSRARQDISFVPAASEAPSAAGPAPVSSRASDAYLAIVLKANKENEPSNAIESSKRPLRSAPISVDPRSSSATQEPRPDTSSNQRAESTDQTVCEICNLPLVPESSLHAASLAHQVCLPHSHPPSHLDRAHVGLRYLQSYGWDPNARKGLGMQGEGIRVPLKGVVKKDTAGLGLEVKGGQRASRITPERLDAGKVRKKYADEKKKGDRLREMFYGDDKVARYLGSG